ncbi:MAG: hypothetical protein KGH95_02455 [Thaumarchaeota archaeon]|nr:hypothetical protein [Nitrososphaerota archaeon]
MSSLQNNTPTLVQMWQYIDKILDPIGMAPDKASLDNGQVFRLYLKLIKIDNSFRDSIQVHILRNQLACAHLESLVN